MGKAMVTFTLDARLGQSRFDIGVPALFVKCYFCVEEYAVGAEFLCTLRYDCGRLGKGIALANNEFYPQQRQLLTEAIYAA